MKIIVEIKRMDDKWEKHVCNDFPIVREFMTLYKRNLKRESINIKLVAGYIICIQP